MRLYLITHAHTHQVKDVAVDTWNLSARGQEQSRRLAEANFWAEVDRIVVTSEAKTWLTIAQIAEARNLPVWVDARFDELRREGWIENYAQQVSLVFAEAERSLTGWESVASVRRRVCLGLADLQQRFHGETLALVGHGLCLSVLRAYILGVSEISFVAWQRLQFGSYASIELDPPAVLHDFPISDNLER